MSNVDPNASIHAIGICVLSDQLNPVQFSSVQFNSIQGTYTQANMVADCNCIQNRNRTQTNECQATTNMNMMINMMMMMMIEQVNSRAHNDPNCVLVLPMDCV